MPTDPHPEPEDLPASLTGQFRSLRLWQAVTIIAVVCCVPLGFLLQASPPGSGMRSVVSTVLGLTIAIAFVALIGLVIAVFRQVIPPAIDYLRHKPRETTNNDAPARRLPLFWAWTISIAAPAAVVLAFLAFPHQRPLLWRIFVVVNALVLGWLWLRRWRSRRSARTPPRPKVGSRKSGAE